MIVGGGLGVINVVESVCKLGFIGKIIIYMVEKYVLIDCIKLSKVLIGLFEFVIWCLVFYLKNVLNVDLKEGLKVILIDV